MDSGLLARGSVSFLRIRILTRPLGRNRAQIDQCAAFAFRSGCKYVELLLRAVPFAGERKQLEQGGAERQVVGPDPQLRSYTFNRFVEFPRVEQLPEVTH